MGWRNIAEWGFGPDNETKRAGRMRVEIANEVSVYTENGQRISGAQ